MVEPDTQVQAFLYGFLAIRVFLLFLSSKIASNIMTQIYTERVLINGEEPPQLTHLIFLFLVIDLVMNMFLMAFIAGMSWFIDRNMGLLYYFVAQYLMSTGLLLVVGYILADMMYRKKYFLYKDDGLRAIRAMQNSLFMIGTVFTLLPMYRMMHGVLREMLVGSRVQGMNARLNNAQRVNNSGRNNSVSF